LFLFQSHRYRRVLPSFPTRRSSDLAGYDPDAFVELFKETPAVHRFPGSMAARVQSLCQAVVDDWGGDASAIWRDADGTTVLKRLDRKSTRLNSSHVKISYAVFCLKK